MKINKKKDGSCILFTQKAASGSSLFDQGKKKTWKKGTLFSRFLKHSENNEIEKERQKEREKTTRSHAREKEREMYKSNKITNDD